MRLRKICPQCNTISHVRRSVCGCGHAFRLMQVMKRKRTLETELDTLLGREKYKGGAGN